MQPIILLHGAIGASDQLLPLENELNDFFTVFKFSFSGHARMPFKNNFGIVQFASELEQFISDKNLHKPIIFGYSMGGYVALYLASQNKDILGKIITLGTKFNWTKEIAEKEILQLNPKVISDKVPKFADVLKKRHGETWEKLLGETADMMINLGNNNLLSDNLLHEIENEVLIGLADKDSMVSLEETVHVYKKLKRAQMYVLPGSKHPIESVNLPVLKQVLLTFCK